jgi:hypothetical protein
VYHHEDKVISINNKRHLISTEAQAVQMHQQLGAVLMELVMDNQDKDIALVVVITNQVVLLVLNNQDHKVMDKLDQKDIKHHKYKHPVLNSVIVHHKDKV